jgi:hypothetical protein
MLTGTVPFDGDSIPEILQHHWWTPAPDASQVRPDSPAALTAAVRRMLSKLPDERFATTADLAAALDAIRLPDERVGTGERQLRDMVRALVPGDPTPRRPRATAPVRATPGATTVPGATIVPGATTSAPVSPRPMPGAATGSTSGVPGAATAGATAAGIPGTTRRLDTPIPPGPRRPAAAAARRRKNAAHWRGIAAIVALIAILGAAGGAVAERRAVNSTVTPRTATDMLRIAHHAYRRGDYELARRFFVRATMLDSTNRVAQVDVGCALLKLGRRAEATARFRAAGDASPGECAILAADAAADTNWLPPAVTGATSP